MTTVPEEAVKAMPERIYAKTHGVSTDVISGQRGLIGGWNEHKRDGQTEFVRSDLIAAYQATALEQAAQIAERPVIGFSDGAVEASRRIASSIRSLSSPDHADAGKVEGDGWLPIESAPKDKMLLLACANWAPVEKLGREVPIKVGYQSFGRWTVFGASWTPTHWRPLPSAPSQEVAGS